MKCSEQNIGSLIFQACIYNTYVFIHIIYIYIYNYRNNTNTNANTNNGNNNDSRNNNNNNNNNKYACKFTYVYICVCVSVCFVHISKPYPLWCTSHAKGLRWWSCPSKSSRKSAWRMFVALATSGNLSQRLFLLQPLYIMTTILTTLW